MAYYIISNKLFEPLILEQSVSETWCEDTQQYVGRKTQC